jgi:hypothetical protein
MNLPTRTCERCSNTWGGREYEPLCTDCKCSDLFRKVSKELEKEVDQLLYDNDILQGIIKLRENLNISLKEGIELFSWRYERLRELAPDKFKKSPEEYWNGFYS